MPVFCHHRSLNVLPAALALFACKGPPPDQVRVELPERVLSSDPVRATVHVRRAGTSSVSREKMDFSVAPADVATVTKDGNITCIATGDAKLLVSVQGVKDDEAVHCRLVDHLEIPNLPLFDLTLSPVTLSVRALTKAGTALDDVPVTISTDSPRVLSVTGSTLTPHAVGLTTMTVQAGDKVKKLPVRVVRSVTAEALPLEGGRRIYFSLSEGKFEVEVNLLLEKDLSIEWRGAPYCGYKGRGRTHRSTCVLSSKGGAVVDNPGFLMAGDTEVRPSGIKIREVP